MSDYGPTEMSYPSDLIPGAPKHDAIAVGDHLCNKRFPGSRLETFEVTKIEGDYVFTRNIYSGSRGVMPLGFYQRGFYKVAPAVSP
jgi:hypothetical protein